MLRASNARCTRLGLLWWILFLWGVDGLIEIVEEQRCADYEFRLTCRELDGHIAILDAWYTSTEDYHQLNTTRPPEPLRIKTENDSELNRVYVYSSPKHNGVYEPTNPTFENFTNVNNSLSVNETFLNLNDSLDAMDLTVEWGNPGNASEGCGVPVFARSYGSWREGDKRRRAADRSASRNLRAPVSYR
ncbi:hypothetical protein O0L34_g3873 [Tuta absoluta]|nr:hypothetical protein O0L34_g3873 [Tuta absoluta]